MSSDHIPDKKVPSIEEMARFIDQSFFDDFSEEIEIRAALRPLYDALAEKDALISEARELLNKEMWVVAYDVPDKQKLIDDLIVKITAWRNKTKGVER
jgi:hypothetical protein